MAGSPGTTVAEQLEQLNNARKLVLENTSYYPNIVQSVLPILQPGHPLEIRRWAADFLSEVFASPALKFPQKEPICLLVLETLKNLVLDPNDDVYVLRNAILTCASVYPLAFNWVIANSYDAPTWERVVTIKTRILQIWDTAPTTIRVCCIKFAQRVVLAQTASNSERQRNDLNINLSMIPQDHPLLNPSHLEAEATGLLDRMLSVLQENSSDAVIVDSTLNSLSILIRTRPGTSNRAMNAVMNFNPLKLANSPMSPKTRVLMKSMEKTTRMLLFHIAKRDPHNPNAPRIHQHIEKLMRSRADILEELNRKRPLPEANGDPSKRQKVQEAAKAQGAVAPAKITTPPLPAAPLDIDVTPLPPGPHSLGELFTFTKDTSLALFHADQIPSGYATNIVIAAFKQTEGKLLTKVTDAVRSRLAEMVKAEVELNPETAPLDVEQEDDDEYEPDFYAAEDTEQILNKLDSAPPERAGGNVDVKPPVATQSLSLGSVSLPPPPALSTETALKVGQSTVARLFDTMRQMDEIAPKKAKSGFNRVAATAPDRDSWITIISRLATRPSASLEEAPTAGGHPNLSDTIREQLYSYIMEDFRRRIEVAASWLCEEWYNDQVTKKTKPNAPLHYDQWVLKVMDGFIGYLNPQDKVFTRFMSEMPELNQDMLRRVKRLCRDPAMVQLVTSTLYYLVLVRPPVRGLVLDTFEAIWMEFEDARPFAEKFLAKWRPKFVEVAKAGKLVPPVKQDPMDC